jgi:rfaE bifunctional protein nucleotidyltransferase chain/domain
LNKSLLSNTKINNLNRLAEEIDEKKSNEQVVIQCHGVFDLLHLGHIKYFQEAKSFGDILVVTVTPDEYVRRGPGRPVFTAEQRAEAIAALEVVDYVTVNQWSTAVRAIELIKPNFYVKGPDYKNHRNDITGNIKLEEEAVKKIGGEMRFTSDIVFSSTKLINQNFNLFNGSQKRYIDKIRKKYSLNTILEYFDKMMQKKILLIGETIIDEYVPCNALGKAGKDPIMTLKKLKGNKYLGGILAISNHLSDLCENINIVSYLGENREYEKYITENLKENISFAAISKSHSPTIIKRRYLDSEKKNKLIGVYDINDTDINDQEENELIGLLSEKIKQSDIVIIADYGHGLLTNKVINFIIKQSKYLCVNTQLNSANIGFHTISKYNRVDYVCMHEGELRHDFRSRYRNVHDLTKNLYDRVEAKLVTVTQGPRGAICFDLDEGFEQCPAFANKIVDKMGAGDTLFAITALAFSVNMPHDIALLLGSLAATETISSVGNSKSINKNIMYKIIETVLK